MKKFFYKKNRYVFEKYNKNYFVLINTENNTLFLYDKDLKVIWDVLDSANNTVDICSILISKGYEITNEEICSIIEELAKLDLIKCDHIKENLEYIKENNQLEKYINECTRNSIPTVIQIELTNKCNLKCIHCYHDENLDSLSIDELSKFFAQIKNSQFVKITLTGGEVGILPYWKDVVKVAEENGFIVTILSTLTNMNRQDLDFLISDNIYAIQTSIYGSNSNFHEKITKTENSFYKTLNGLKYLKEKGCNVSATCTVMKENFDDIINIKKLMHILDINIIFDYRILESRNNTKNIKDMLINSQEYKYLEKHGIFQKKEKIICTACCHRIGISQKGEIFACPSLRVPLGNMKRDNLIKIVNSDFFKKLEKDVKAYYPEECLRCDYDKFCTKCPGYMWKEGYISNEVSKNLCAHTKISCS